MLNRLFIVVVSLIILVIAAAFIVPLFVDWSQYRDRLEAIASEALGHEVHVAGDFTVRFLPQPRMQFDDVIVGPETAPLIEVASVEAEFSLTDFLRDHYTVTSLVLLAPRLNISVGADGRITNLLRLPEVVGAGTVTVADAEIVEGVVRLADSRAGDTTQIEKFNGRLQMSGIRGPFSLQGGFEQDGRALDGRVTTSAINDEGVIQLSGFVQARDLGFSVAVDGLAQTAGRLQFDGTTEIRIAVEDSEEAAGVRGDVVFASKTTADADELMFSEYILLPDANRPATRMTGTARVFLGAERRFDASLSGGVVALAERNALVAEDQRHYALVSLLKDLPAPLVPPMKGQLSLELAELDARAFTMRQVTATATSTGEGWEISSLTAQMLGSTALSLEGTLAAKDGLPQFDGSMSLRSQRLSTFAAQWRKPTQNPALLNISGGIEGRLRVVDGALVLDQGTLSIDGVESEVGVVVGKAGESLSLRADLSALSAVQSAMLASLAPETRGWTPPGFDTGSFNVTAEYLDLWGLPVQELKTTGNWSSAGLHVERFSSANWGGLELDIQADLTGESDAPQFFGGGSVSVRQPQSALLTKILQQLNTPQETISHITDMAPVALEFGLSEPFSGAQTLSLELESGPINISGDIVLSEGLAKSLEAPMAADISGSAVDAEALAAHIGLDALPMGRPGQPVRMTLAADGSPSNSLDVEVNITASGERLNFVGGTIVTDLTQLRGGGRMGFTLSDVASLVEMAGAAGVGAGPVSGEADVRFGGGRLTLSNIDALAAGAQISGNIARESFGGGYIFDGELAVGRIGVDSLAKVLGGRTAVAITGDVWPEGPFAISDKPRDARGKIHVTADEIRLDGRRFASGAEFEIDWDDSQVRLRALEADLGGGRISLDARICCHGALLERELNGRVSLSGVNVDAVLPEAPAEIMQGSINVGLQFTGTGASFAEQMSSMTGEGSFSLSELSVERLDPEAFYTLVDVVDVLEKQEGELESEVRATLDEGTFSSGNFGGLISVAGGTMRIANVVSEGDAARLIGGMNFSLADLGLDGRWTMTPVDQADGRTASGGAEVTAIVGGTIIAPDIHLDLTSLIEGVKFEAYGREVERLEALKAEQDARAAAAAEQRARLQAEMAQQLEEQRIAEEEERQREAARRAAEAEAAEQRRREEEQALDLLGGGTSTESITPLFLPPENVGTAQQF